MTCTAHPYPHIRKKYHDKDRYHVIDSYHDVTSWLLQPGSKQVAAGYVVYGSSTILVYSVGNGVHGFTLDPAIGAYVLSHENIRTPERVSTFSINEGNACRWGEPVKRWAEWIKAEDKATSRPDFLVKLIEAVQDAVDVPLAFDYPSYAVQEICLRTYRPEKARERRPIVNSVSELRLDMLDLIKIQPFRLVLMASERVENGQELPNTAGENVNGYMPTGLVVTLTKDEILDLLAYVMAGGNAEHPVFRPRD